MNELAVQSANDTNISQTDRQAMQEEFNALLEEIDSIADRTEFNKQKLIDGSFTDKNFHIGANEGQNITVSIDNMDVESLGLDGLAVEDLEHATGEEDGTITGGRSEEHTSELQSRFDL